MAFRLLLSFVVLAGSTSALLYLALCTDFFVEKGRIRRIARNAGLLAAGGIIATICLAFLVALTS